MIEVISVQKIFEGNFTLHNISAVFSPGIINMIIGASGSGKTVLLKCIVGLLDPNNGDIIFDGRNFTQGSYKERKKIRLEIGMLFQGSALFNSLSVEENIGFPLKMFANMTSMEMKKRIDFCLERVDLGKINHLYPGELSGGMQKRVGIARAIVMNPKYLFCDEPNSGLDPKTSRVIDELIKEITIEFNTTTILNSHDMTSVFDIGEEIIFMFEGEKWWEGNPSEIKGSANKELLQMIDASGHEFK